MRAINIVTTTLLTTALLIVFGSEHSTANTITPNEHFKIEDPADVSGEQAEQMYQRIAGRMKRGYALADYPAAKYYQQWTRYNTTPYLSEGHGNRFLNNYGNRTARDYLSLQPGEKMPCLLYTSPSPRDATLSRMPSSA